MMNTRYGWGEPSEPGDQWSELVDQEFFAKFFTEDLYHLGVAHSMAWDEFIPLIPSDSHYDWIAKSITLFGDPVLPMWLNAPDGALQLDGPEYLAVGVNNVVISVTDASGPVSDARVCFMQGDWEEPSMYEVGYTDGSGQVNMTVTATDEHDTAALTAWSRDHAPITVDVAVTGTGLTRPDTPLLVPSLSRPFPNPVSGSAVFNWVSPQGNAVLSIMDASGRMVRRVELKDQNAGAFTWQCDDQSGRSVPSGIYFALFQPQGAEPITRRLVVIGDE